jgi:outer membrane protein OmpA-like peptidoglycan-associated protein
MPAGDIFVTNSADTPFSVIASKGAVSGSSSSSMNGLDDPSAVKQQVQQGSGQAPMLPDQQAQQQQQEQQPPPQQQHSNEQQQQQQQQQLWKVFSEEPLSGALLQQLFINGSVVISKAWKAYPQ